MTLDLPRLSLLLAAAFVAACGGAAPAPAQTTTGEQKGMFGVYYYVNVSRPVGGTIRSTDGKINCGTIGGPNGTCGQAKYLWTETATLTAVPDEGKLFQSWAADCSGSVVDGCVLNTTPYGADKWVVAVFNLPGSLGHGSMASPSLHAPKFFDFLANVASAPRCNTCHGTTYSGQGIAPSCNACHAAAGWANWQQNCSFCHGRKDATTKASDTFAAHPEWAAPPDDVKGRLTGTNDLTVVGAHQSHVTDNAIRKALACSECHVVPATAIHTLDRSSDLAFNALATHNGTLTPTWVTSKPTCGSTYCHGATLAGGTLKNPTWTDATAAATACGACHGFPPPSPHVSATSCVGCHPDTIVAGTASTIDVAKGKHINGTTDVVGGACDSCHGFPPANGAHLTHFGLTAAQGTSGYGDLSTLETRFPTATPTTAPATYAYGCGNCHPLDSARHMDGTVQVELYNPAAPAGSLKALNPLGPGPGGASYTSGPNQFTGGVKAYSDGTCSNVYCHSSGQETTLTSSPEYIVTPAWTSTAKLACDGCHKNPPRYPSGGRATATANTHLNLDLDGWEYGHFLGLPGPDHSSKHGGAAGWGPGYDSAPITCQTCHFETTDPANTGTSRFYWLDTTGSYRLPGGDPWRTDPYYAAWWASLDCATCHTTTVPSQVSSTVGLIKTGRVLPLRHVNGSRDVVFDKRTSLPANSLLPAYPNTPTLPYWTSPVGATGNWASDTILEGTTRSFTLGTATYNASNKSCSNVACHLAQGSDWYKPYVPLIWGDTAGGGWGSEPCNRCHQY